MIRKKLYISRWLLRVIATIIMFVGISIYSSAQMTEFWTEVDGVRYRTDFNMSLLNKSYDTCSSKEWYMPEHQMHLRYFTIRDRSECQIEADKFVYFDGSELPLFHYGAILVSSNTPRYKGLPLAEEGKDVMAQRDPYYKGDVWIQDSVEMPDFPNVHNKKYHIVYNLGYSKSFGDELLSIRTPRYAVVSSEVFMDCIKLQTARIGTAQCVQKNAFKNCTALETIFFETGPKIENDAFYNCPNIKYIIIEDKAPLTGSSAADNYSPFDRKVYENAILYAHENQIEGLKNDPTWSKFKNIRDIEEYLSGLETIVPDSEVRYYIYNLSGLLVKSAITGDNWREGLPSGVYIVKSSLGTVKKEYVK